MDRKTINALARRAGLDVTEIQDEVVIKTPQGFTQDQARALFGDTEQI